MRMKKCFTMILSFLLALMLSVPDAPNASCALAAEAGETVMVEFTVLEDSGAVYAAKLELQYDHEALELVPNRSFESDRKMYFYEVPLRATFRVRENAAPGDYPVTLKILDASGPMGEAVLSPETALVFSEEHVNVERPLVEVPVYYMLAGDGSILTTDSVMLASGQTTGVKANALEGWIVSGEQSMPVTVTEDGKAIPPSVTFWLATPSPAPTKEPIRVGGYMTFGSYEQDNDTGNGKEPIEWLVLEVRGETALLISRYALDCKPYNTKSESVTWETCSLRSWLNGEFLNSAFSVKERQAIQWTTVDNSASQGYSRWNTSDGKDTKDRIFLLSYAEAWSYFSSDSARQCQPTKYAAARGAYKAGNGNCQWWLRSPGYYQFFAALVFLVGSLYFNLVHNDSGCVRPALWVDLTSDIF